MVTPYERFLAEEAEAVSTLPLTATMPRTQRRTVQRSIAARFKRDLAESLRKYPDTVVMDVLDNGTLADVCWHYMDVVDPVGRFGMDRWIDAIHRNGRHPGPADPTKPIRLYRGAPRDYAHGLSWTTSRAVAEYFRDQWQQAEVFQLDATWPEVLVRIDQMPKWFEYLIDARKHEVMPIPGSRTRNPHGRRP